MKSLCCNAEILEESKQLPLLHVNMNMCSSCGSPCEVDTFHTVMIKPLSVNNMYMQKAVKQKGTGKWIVKRIKTQEARAWKNDVHYILPRNLKFSGQLRLELEIAFSNANSDLDNGVKAIQDALQDKYGFNDNKIYELRARKILVKKGSEYFRFKLTELNK